MTGFTVKAAKKDTALAQLVLLAFLCSAILASDLSETQLASQYFEFPARLVKPTQPPGQPVMGDIYLMSHSTTVVCGLSQAL